MRHFLFWEEVGSRVRIHFIFHKDRKWPANNKKEKFVK